MSIHAYYMDPGTQTPDQFFNSICAMPITWEHEDNRLIQHTGDGYFEITGTVTGLVEVDFRDPPLIDPTSIE